mgnify:CR=1 FL=1
MVRGGGLVLGTASFARGYGLSPAADGVPSDYDPVSIISSASDAGFDGIDTAPVYGNAEHLLGTSGTRLRVYTKLRWGIRAVDSLVQSLSALRRDSVEGVFFHEEFTLSPRQEAQLEELALLKGQVFRMIGASIYSEEEFHRANANSSIDIIQLPFNVLDRRFSQTFLSNHAVPGKKYIARSVFLQGSILAPNGRLPPQVRHLESWVEGFQDIARSFGLSAVQAALGFAASNLAVTSLVVGARSATDVWELARAAREGVPASFIHAVESAPWPSWPLTDPRKWKTL